MIESRSKDIVKEVANLVDVILDSGIVMKKKGANYVGCCPFHQEKSGSFTVSIASQFYKCFGCGASGDVFEFLIKHKGYQFEEAVEFLANKYNIQLDYTNEVYNAEEKDEFKKGWEFMGKVKRLYHSLLMANAMAKAYMNDRGFSDETLALWEIGFAPANWRTITEMAIKESQWDLAVKCGVCVEQDEKNRDFFYNRIMIPIHDAKANCISFGGRIWTPEQAGKNEAKYMNGKESYLYSKESILFGMHLANLPMSKSKEAFLVEGYLDVIKAHQEEINNVVAACGTSVTASQAKAIIKRAKNIVLAGDNDEAGAKSISKSINLFYSEGAEKVEVIQWPDEIKDIDQFLKPTTDENN